jgi:hypothetical protein
LSDITEEEEEEEEVEGQLSSASQTSSRECYTFVKREQAVRASTGMQFLISH